MNKSGQKLSTKLAKKLANLFGGLGYMSVLAQWAWSVIPLVYLIINDRTISGYILPNPESSSPKPAIDPIALPDGVSLVIVILAIVFSIAAIIYALVAVPRTIAKTGQQITQKSAKALVPSITHHKKISQKQKRRLITRLTWTVKFGLAVVPAILLLVPLPKSIKLTGTQFIAMGLVLLAFSLAMFVIQFIITRLAKIDSKKVW